MANIKKITYIDKNFKSNNIELIKNLEDNIPKISAITGKNGSNKSSILGEIVKDFVHTSHESIIEYSNKNKSNIICLSGTLSDRFPSKLNNNGGTTLFDSPNYIYYGQRIGKNNLNNKKPFENILIHALDEEKSHRCNWENFSKAHYFSKTYPSLLFVINRSKITKERNFNLVSLLRKIISNSEEEQPIIFKGKISKKTAGWILENFHYSSYVDLENLYLKWRPIYTEISYDGIKSYGADNEAIRLGLILGLLTLNDVIVSKINLKFNSIIDQLNKKNTNNIYKITKSQNKYYSAFDLSSGELNILTNLLGLIFSIDENSLVLIDEPENSLHPQWQQNYIEEILKIFETKAISGHLIISTHSPLILASLPKHSNVIDLENQNTFEENNIYGASADEILFTQFGISSSRNKALVDIIQEAVSLIENGLMDSDEYTNILPKLIATQKNLDKNDPLYEILTTIIYANN